MKTYILYTTSKSKRVQEQADIFASEISKTKGRGEVKIKVVHKLPRRVVTAQEKLSWEWFKTALPKEDNDGVIFHFTPYYRSKWNIREATNGSRNSDNLDYPEFWVCDDLSTTPSDGYPAHITGFLRKLFHEHAHFDEDLDDTLGNVLTQNSVHDMDYRLKKIHLYHYLVDYRGKAFKESVNRVLLSVMRLAKKII